MALELMLEPFSKWYVDLQLPPTLGVTWSLIRVVVSFLAYGRSQLWVCPHALKTRLRRE